VSVHFAGRPFRRVQTQLGLALLLIRTVTGNTGIRNQRANIAIEINLLLSGCKRIARKKEKRKKRACPKITHRAHRQRNRHICRMAILRDGGVGLMRYFRTSKLSFIQDLPVLTEQLSLKPERQFPLFLPMTLIPLSALAAGSTRIIELRLCQLCSLKG